MSSFQSVTPPPLPDQVKHLNFYDIVLDFILMDSFEDLENPPVSIQNVINNRWLNSSFKETVRKQVPSKGVLEFVKWAKVKHFSSFPNTAVVN